MDKDAIAEELEREEPPTKVRARCRCHLVVVADLCDCHKEEVVRSNVRRELRKAKEQKKFQKTKR